MITPCPYVCQPAGSFRLTREVTGQSRSENFDLEHRETHLMLQDSLRARSGRYFILLPSFSRELERRPCSTNHDRMNHKLVFQWLVSRPSDAIRDQLHAGTFVAGCRHASTGNATWSCLLRSEKCSFERLRTKYSAGCSFALGTTKRRCVKGKCRRRACKGSRPVDESEPLHPLLRILWVLPFRRHVCEQDGLL